MKDDLISRKAAIATLALNTEEDPMGMKTIRQIIEVYDYCPHSKDCDHDACPYFNSGYPHCYYGLIDDAMNCLKKRIEEEDEE